MLLSHGVNAPRALEPCECRNRSPANASRRNVAAYDRSPAWLEQQRARLFLQLLAIHFHRRGGDDVSRCAGHPRCVTTERRIATAIHSPRSETCVRALRAKALTQNPLQRLARAALLPFANGGATRWRDLPATS